MVRVEQIVRQMRRAPQNVRYDDLAKVCEEHFGDARQQGTSHAVYPTPWAGDPRVNIQRGRDGKAKTYQVRQVLAAIDRRAREDALDPDGPARDEQEVTDDD